MSETYWDELREWEDRIEQERAAQAEYDAYCAAYERDYWQAWGWFCGMFEGEGDE